MQDPRDKRLSDQSDYDPPFNPYQSDEPVNPYGPEAPYQADDNPGYAPSSVPYQSDESATHDEAVTPPDEAGNFADEPLMLYSSAPTTIPVASVVPRKKS